MSASSQYYSSAHPHSHYQSFPSNNHDQTYATFIGTWQQDSNHAHAHAHTSYAGPSSVPLLHYPQAGQSSDYPRPHQPPAPQTWHAGYAQPNVQEWTATVGDRVDEQSFAPRLGGSYDIAEGGASVQHTTPNVARPYPPPHHQQASHAEHEQPLASPDGASRDTDRFTALRITSVSVKTFACYAKPRLRLTDPRSPLPRRQTHLSQTMYEEHTRSLIHRMQYRKQTSTTHMLCCRPRRPGVTQPS